MKLTKYQIIWIIIGFIGFISLITFSIVPLEIFDNNITGIFSTINIIFLCVFIFLLTEGLFIFIIMDDGISAWIIKKIICFMLSCLSIFIISLFGYSINSLISYSCNNITFIVIISLCLIGIVIYFLINGYIAKKIAKY